MLLSVIVRLSRTVMKSSAERPSPWKMLHMISTSPNFILPVVKTVFLIISIVHWGYKENFKPVYLIFFLTKSFRAHKNTSQSKINQQNKNKLMLNSKGNNFSRAYKPLGVTCFCAREIFSSKKISRLEIVLITSIYNTTSLAHLNHDKKTLLFLV